MMLGIRMLILCSHSVPFRFPGLYGIGCAFFLFNIVLFFFNILMISARFYLYPSTFKGSFVHPTESLFIPAAIISFGTILINITQYGVTGGSARPWLEYVMTFMYWFYCVLAIVFSCVIYLIMYVLHSPLFSSNITHISLVSAPTLPT